METPSAERVLAFICIRPHYHLCYGRKQQKKSTFVRLHLPRLFGVNALVPRVHGRSTISHRYLIFAAYPYVLSVPHLLLAVPCISEVAMHRWIFLLAVLSWVPSL